MIKRIAPLLMVFILYSLRSGNGVFIQEVASV